MRFLTTLLFLFVASLANSWCVAQSLPFTLGPNVNVGNRPESVIGDNDFLYASNFGTGASLTRDGNGYISKIGYDGTLIDRNFITLPGQLDSPTGMAFLGDRLFVADIDEVIGFDLNQVAAPIRISLSQFNVSFANDLVAVSDHQLVVSGTNRKKLFLIDTTAQTSTELALDFALSVPNGLAFDAESSQLYVAANAVHSIGSSNNNGEILELALDIDGSSATRTNRYSAAGRFLDGIALYGEDQLIYSDWVSGSSPNGKLAIVNRGDLPRGTPRFGTPTELALAGFADFHWQPSRGILAAPNLVGGRVQLIGLPVPVPEPSAGLILMALLIVGVGRRR